MPYVTNTAGLARLAEAAKPMGIEWTETWWHDEQELEKAWKARGWPFDDLMAGGLDIGGCVGWFNLSDFHQHGRHWVLICVSPIDLEHWEPDQLVQARKLPLLTEAVYQHRFGSNRVPVDPVAVGARVAGTQRDGKCFIGFASAVDELGRVTFVMLSEESGAEAAEQYAKRWFAIGDDRWDSFDKLWAKGETQFKNYFTMRNRLRRSKAPAEAPQAAPAPPKPVAVAPPAPSVIIKAPKPVPPKPAEELDWSKQATAQMLAWVADGTIADTPEAKAAAWQHAANWLKSQKKD